MSRQPSRPTIADVARLAGVSKTTVSRVLNGRTQYVQDGTLERVRAAVQELEYRPSGVARSLVSKRTHSVGLLISDVANPFYPEVIHGVEDVALQHGYSVFLCNTSYELERGMAFVRSLSDQRVDGVLLMSSSMSDELVVALAREAIPVVLLDWQLSHIEGMVSTIQVAFEEGIGQAARHLVELGHRHFAHVSGPLRLPTARRRYQCFRETLISLGIDGSQISLVEGDFTIESGRRALTKLLTPSTFPTAVFAGNDLMALGVLWAARAEGIDVPKQLSLVGLDDVRLASEVTPPLTSVALPRQRLGELAMEMLLELLDLPPQTPQQPVDQRVVETALVVRCSTAVAPGQ